MIGVKELDREILMHLDDQSLGCVLQINRWANEVCDDFFWRERTLRTHDLEVLEWRMADESHRGQYIRLARLTISEEQAIESSEGGRFDETLVLKQRGIPFSPKLMYAAACGGRLEIMKRLHREGIELRGRLMKGAAENGHLEVMEWLVDQGVAIKPSLISSALYGGSTRILDWLVQRGLIIDPMDMMHAMSGGSIEVVEWLIQRGLQPSQEYAYFAAIEKHVDLFEHLASRYGIRPQFDQNEINRIACRGHPEILEWLNGRPDQRTIDLIADIVQYLAGDTDFPTYRIYKMKKRLRLRGLPSRILRKLRLGIIEGSRNWEEIQKEYTPEELQDLINDYRRVLQWLIRG